MLYMFDEKKEDEPFLECYYVEGHQRKPNDEVWVLISCVDT